MQELKEIIENIEIMMKNCDVDYNELKDSEINKEFFEDYKNVRIVNSFLFNYSKIQDKMGAKLFRKSLYTLKEIDDENLPMKDVLNILEKLNIVENSKDWDKLREIRNILSHEYPIYIEERIENILLALNGYFLMKKIFYNLKRFTGI